MSLAIKSCLGSILGRRFLTVAQQTLACLVEVVVLAGVNQTISVRQWMIILVNLALDLRRGTREVAILFVCPQCRLTYNLSLPAQAPFFIPHLSSPCALLTRCVLHREF